MPELLYICPKCGTTYLLEEGEKSGMCTKCMKALMQVCEWCGEPEKGCKCGKELIKT